MSGDKEILMAQKATVYDLERILEQNPGKAYTVEELRQLMDAYIQGMEQ